MTHATPAGTAAKTVLTGTTWDHPRGYAGLAAATAQIDRQMPESRLDWHTHSLADFSALPIERVAGQSDLVVFDHPFVGDVSRSGVLFDLYDCLEPRFIDALRRDVVGFGVDLYEYGGGLWALPLDAACQVAAFRTDLCEKAGVPREELRRAALPGIITALAGTGLKLAISFRGVGSIMTFFSICHQLGATPFQHGSRLVPDAAGLDAIGTMKRILASSTPDVLDWDSIACLENMARRDDLAYCPYIFGFSAYSTDRYGAIDGRRPIEFGAARLLPNSTTGGIIGGAGLGISRRCRHPRLAARYVEQLLGARYQLDMALNLGQPGRRSVWTNNEANRETRDFFAATVESMDRGFIRPREPDFVGKQDEAGDRLEHHLRRASGSELILRELNEIFGF